MLHRLVYVAISLAAVHYLLATKVLDATQAVHVLLVAGLLGYRLVRGVIRRPERRMA
jgi:sulfoxide reductase heme-binding subunit YedZ